MSRLFDPDEVFQEKKPPKPNQKILRNRKKRPLHPSTIEDMLRTRAAEETVEKDEQEWLLILWKKDYTKQYSDLSGSYTKVQREAADILASGDGEYWQAWLRLKTPGDR